MSDIEHLLMLVEKYLLLGKDQWERLTMAYNASRARGAPERDYESLHRKFKVL